MPLPAFRERPYSLNVIQHGKGYLLDFAIQDGCLGMNFRSGKMSRPRRICLPTESDL